MKVIDFNEEEQLIKKDIERARANMKDVEDLSDFGSTKEKKTPEKKPSDSKKKMKKDEEEEPLTSKAIIKEVISVIKCTYLLFGGFFNHSVCRSENCCQWQIYGGYTSG